MAELLKDIQTYWDMRAGGFSDASMEERNSSVKMRIDYLLCFTVIPHCIVIAVCPVLKEDTLWSNMQFKSAFLYARMLEKNFGFSAVYVIYSYLVAHIKEQVIFIKAKVAVTFSFIYLLFCSRRKIPDIYCRIFA